MTQYILTLADNKVSSAFLEFVKKLDFVHGVEEVDETTKPLTAEDWSKPGRPATDEEFENLVAEMDAEEKSSLGMFAEEAEEYVTKRIEEWKKKSE
jgi:hypothetical protein